MVHILQSLIITYKTSSSYQDRDDIGYFIHFNNFRIDWWINFKMVYFLILGDWMDIKIMQVEI